MSLLLVTHDPLFLPIASDRALFIADEVSELRPDEAAAAISLENP